MAGSEAQQARGARVVRECAWDWRVWRVADIDGAWRHVATRRARARQAESSAGACDAVSGRSWLGFARDWLFCLSMPLLWQLNAQNVDIRVLQVLWA